MVRTRSMIHAMSPTYTPEPVPVSRCEICDLAMYKKKDLKQHKKSEAHRMVCESMGMYCSECKKCFQSLDGKLSHNAAKHAGALPSEGGRTEDPPAKDPEAERQSPWFFRCECSQIFPTENLEEHLETHPDVANGINVTLFPFSCVDHEADAPTRPELNAKESGQDAEGELPALCRNDCGEVYPEDVLIQAAHHCAADQRNHQIDIQEQILHASEEHHPVSNPKISKGKKTCNFCGVFQGKKKNHKKSPEHIASCKAMSAYCGDCNTCLQSAEARQLHWNRVHSPSRPTVFLCSDCGISFPTRTRLKKHYRQHLEPNHGKATNQGGDSTIVLIAKNARCEVCDLDVSSWKDLRIHNNATEHVDACKRMNAYCSYCQKCFNSAKAYRFHCGIEHNPLDAEVAFWCEGCSRGFATINSLSEHELEGCGQRHGPASPVGNSSQPYHQAPKPEPLICKICDQPKLKWHTKTAEHIAACQRINTYCPDCQRCFKSSKKYQRHWAKKHDPERPTEFHCCDCDQSFHSNYKLNCHLREHAAQSDNGESACPTCGKVILKKKTREHHIRSCRAAVKKTLPCLGGEKCTRAFGSPSAMVMHLESGSCASKMDRKMIKEIVRNHDVQRSITMPDVAAQPSELVSALKSLEEHATDLIDYEILSDSDSDSESGGVLILTPTVSSSTISATMTPIGPARWQCIICSKEFKSRRSMESHINSGTHDPFSYHCPLRFMGIGVASEERAFKTLSALLQHLEHGACKGGNETFINAMVLVEQVARGLGFDGLRLLTSDQHAARNVVKSDEARQGDLEVGSWSFIGSSSGRL